VGTSHEGEFQSLRKKIRGIAQSVSMSLKGKSERSTRRQRGGGVREDVRGRRGGGEFSAGIEISQINDRRGSSCSASEKGPNCGRANDKKKRKNLREGGETAEKRTEESAGGKKKAVALWRKKCRLAFFRGARPCGPRESLSPATRHGS